MSFRGRKTYTKNKAFCFKMAAVWVLANIGRCQRTLVSPSGSSDTRSHCIVDQSQSELLNALSLGVEARGFVGSLWSGLLVSAVLRWGAHWRPRTRWRVRSVWCSYRSQSRQSPRHGPGRSPASRIFMTTITSTIGKKRDGIDFPLHCCSTVVLATELKYLSFCEFVGNWGGCSNDHCKGPRIDLFFEPTTVEEVQWPVFW